MIRPVDLMNVRTGDIITYKAPIEPDLTITHRVVEVTKEAASLGFRTKGDANKATDAFVIPSENALGKVWLYVPLFGHFVGFVKTPFGFVLCLAVPGALIIWSECRKIISIVRLEAERKSESIR